MTGVVVELLDSMGSDIDVVNAARASFGKHVDTLTNKDIKLIDYLATGLRTKEREALIGRILDVGQGDLNDPASRTTASKIIDEIQAIQKHWVPFTHVVAKFRITCPIFVARQITRSEAGFTRSEESRRYVDRPPEFYTPKTWRGRPKDAKQGSSGVVHWVDRPGEQSRIPVGELYRFAQEAADQHYSLMIQAGVAPEQARMVLPQSTLTTWTWTANLYSWANLCRQRLDPHAQEETREVVMPISETMWGVAPVSWGALLRLPKP